MRDLVSHEVLEVNGGVLPLLTFSLGALMGYQLGLVHFGFEMENNFNKLALIAARAIASLGTCEVALDAYKTQFGELSASNVSHVANATVANMTDVGLNATLS